MVSQKKTGGPVQFEITKQTHNAVGEWLAALSAGRDQYLFEPSPEAPHLSTPQYGIRDALDAVHQAGADLQEDGELESRTAPPRTYEA
jgi:hypothetical protein